MRIGGLWGPGWHTDLLLQFVVALLLALRAHHSIRVPLHCAAVHSDLDAGVLVNALGHLMRQKNGNQEIKWGTKIGNEMGTKMGTKILEQKNRGTIMGTIWKMRNTIGNWRLKVGVTKAIRFLRTLGICGTREFSLINFIKWWYFNQSYGQLYVVYVAKITVFWP